jgi:hypothetical protein
VLALFNPQSEIRNPRSNIHHGERGVPLLEAVLALEFNDFANFSESGQASRSIHEGRY